VSKKTCAVILELIQSEGGVYVATKEYVTQLRRLADEKDILVILDEVQTGIGRTGKLFGYEHYGIEPDVISLAKALGSGFPVGAIIAKDQAAAAFEPGTHASTFGGNALACSAIVATMNTLMEDGVVANCEKMGKYLVEGLLAFKRRFPIIVDIRGMGLLLGVELSIEGEPLVQEFMKEGVILYATKGNVLRLLPPLVIGKEEIDLFLDIAARIFERHVS
jgi:acetylornithine/N-succinyldiaminopimelate aminotransferase